MFKAEEPEKLRLNTLNFKYVHEETNKMLKITSFD